MDEVVGFGVQMAVINKYSNICKWRKKGIQSNTSVCFSETIQETDLALPYVYWTF